MKQYQGLAGWDAITRIFGYRMNQAHTAIMQLAYMRAMLRGVGSQLDTLGTMLGQAREGLSDSDFLDVLLTRVVQFNGDATAEDLINIANLLGRPTVMQYVEGVAAFSILLVGPNPINSRNDLLNSLAVSKLAGVQMQTLKASSPVFTFDLVDANHAGFDIGHLADRY